MVISCDEVREMWVQRMESGLRGAIYSMLEPKGSYLYFLPSQ